MSTDVIDATTHVSRKRMASLLGIHPLTLDRARRRGDGPPWVRIGKLIRYPLGPALTEWQRQHQK